MESAQQTFKEKLQNCLSIPLENNYENTFQKWEELLVEFPNRPVVRIKFSQFLTFNNRLEEANRILTSNSELYASNQQLKMRHINILFKLHLWESTIDILNELIINDKNNSFFIFKKIEALVHLKQIKLAEHFLIENAHRLSKHHKANIYQ